MPTDRMRSVEPFTAEFPALPDGTLEIAGRTDVGLIREHNEDSFLFGDLCLATPSTKTSCRSSPRGSCPRDLDGGRRCRRRASGEIASSMATQIAYDYLRDQLAEGRPERHRRRR